MTPLFYDITEYEGRSLFLDVLSPWLIKNKASVSKWLNRFKNIETSISVEDLWQLYALSRISDILIEKIHIREIEKTSILHTEYNAFFFSLGFSPITENSFHPFYHEIVEVLPSHNLLPKINRQLWTGLMLGNMLFSRMGVVIDSKSELIDKDIAEHSILYWSYIRSNRQCSDLSHGWGHNSQWKTTFRRDYQLENMYAYNVDGNRDILTTTFEDDELILLREEYIEIIRNRSAIKCKKDCSDLFPYDFTFFEYFIHESKF